MDTIIDTVAVKDAQNTRETVSKEKPDIYERCRASARSLEAIHKAVLEIAPAGVTPESLQDKAEETNRAIEKVVTDTPVVTDLKTQEELTLLEIRDRIEDDRFAVDELKQAVFLEEMMKSSPLLRWTVLNKLRDKAISLTLGREFNNLTTADSRSDVRSEFTHITEVFNRLLEADQPIPLAEAGALIHDIFKWSDNKFYLAEHEVMSAWYAGEVFEETITEVIAMLQSPNSDLLGGLTNNKNLAGAAAKYDIPLEQIMERISALDTEALARIMRKLVLTHGNHEFPKFMSANWIVSAAKRIQLLNLAQGTRKGIYPATVSPKEMKWTYEADETEEAETLEQKFQEEGEAINAGDMATGLSLASLLKYSKSYAVNEFTDGFQNYVDRMFGSFGSNYKNAPESFNIKDSNKVTRERYAATLFWDVVQEVSALPQDSLIPEHYRKKLIFNPSKKIEEIDTFSQKILGKEYSQLYSDALIKDARAALTLSGEEYRKNYDEMLTVYGPRFNAALKDIRMEPYEEKNLEAEYEKRFKTDMATQKEGTDFGVIMFEEVFKLKKLAADIQQKLFEKDEEGARTIKNTFDNALSDLFARMKDLSLDELQQSGPVTERIEKILENRFGGLPKNHEIRS